MRGERHPLTYQGPNRWSYRGFQIEREPATGPFNPYARLYSVEVRGRCYRFHSREEARREIDTALDA
jgi:hypothetical protein